MRRVLAGLLAGGALGLLLPLPNAQPGQHVSDQVPVSMSSAKPSAGPDSPEATPTVRPEPASRRLCVNRERLDSARISALDAERTLAAEASSFALEWGVPLDPPLNWDPEDAADKLHRRLELLDSVYADVDCDQYPCRVLIASAVERDLDALAVHFGVHTAQVSSTSVGSGPSKTFLDTVILAPRGELSKEHSLWIRRLVNRQIARAVDELNRSSGAIEGTSGTHPPLP